ncbi:MAG: alpha-L-fucosidase [Rikenellaceae bacterium]
MKAKLMIGSLAIAAAATLASCGSSYYPDISTTASPKGTNVFQPDSASIAQNYTIPEWFSDSKLGIFIHYGVYAVPAYGSEWYARWMYTENSKIYKHHVEKFGPVTEFGYKDFIPMFQAPKFDATEWAEIFKASGAKYVVPVAEHHDGFSMYDSAWNEWNSVDMGPHKDFVGELAKAVRDEGMIFGLSSHRAENPWFYNEGMKFPSDVRDTDCTLYGQRIERPEGKGMTPEYGRYEGSNEESREQWLLHMYELIDMYQPELIWFDWTVGKYPFQPTFYKFMAYYYNSALDWGKEVVVNTKTGFGDNIQVFDIERGKSDRIRHYAWQTDTSVGNKSWSYTPDEVNKKPDQVVDDFIDIVSKNGNLLLNVGPKMEGTITPEQESVLRDLGAWLEVNGEAIYNTRHWVRWGEGVTEGTSGYMTDRVATAYTPQDVRFTHNGDTLYALTLDWESGAEVTIKALAPAYGKNIKVNSVELVGSKEKIEWSYSDKGLKIIYPKVKPSDYAHAFKINYTGVVYGDIQGDIVNDTTVVVEQYISNTTGNTEVVNVKCTSNSSTESQKVTLKPHSTTYVKFEIPTKDDVNDVKLYVDGKLISEKTLTTAAAAKMAGKTKSVIHNTDDLYGTPEKSAKKKKN